MASTVGGGVDVSHVCALTRAARKPANFHRHTRGAELYERAIAAAEALRQPDCLIVASLRHMHLVARGKAAFRGISLDDHVAVRDALGAHLAMCEARLPAVLETLERRRASGTLLPGRCRAHEVAWYADVVRTDLSHLPAEQRPADEAALRLVSPAAPLVGVAVYFHAAHTVALTPAGLSEAHPPDDSFHESCLTFTEHALRLVLQRASVEPTHVSLPSSSSFFVDVFRTRLLPCLRPQVPGCARILAAWHDLEHSGALNKLLSKEQRERARRTERQLADAQAAKDAGVPLRSCALPSCGAREAHVAHFKKCGACAAVVYCSKQHQAEHWPAHKAACKAARKAASQGAGEGGASQDA